MAKITKSGPVTIIDTDLGFNRIRSEFLIPIIIDVGVLEKDGLKLKTGSKSTTLAQVAQVHEFGDPERNIPQRSFLRSTVDEHKGYIAELTIAVSSVVSGIGKFAASTGVGIGDMSDMLSEGTDPYPPFVVPGLKTKGGQRFLE